MRHEEKYTSDRWADDSGSVFEDWMIIKIYNKEQGALIRMGCPAVKNKVHNDLLTDSMELVVVASSWLRRYDGSVVQLF